MRIYRSAYADIDIPDLAITELTFAGLEGREGEPAGNHGIVTSSESRTGGSGNRTSGGTSSRSTSRVRRTR